MLVISPPPLWFVIVTCLFTHLVTDWSILATSISPCRVKPLMFLLRGHSLGYMPKVILGDKDFGRLSLTFSFPNHTHLLSVTNC